MLAPLLLAVLGCRKPAESTAPVDEGPPAATVNFGVPGSVVSAAAALRGGTLVLVWEQGQGEIWAATWRDGAATSLVGRRIDERASAAHKPALACSRARCLAAWTERSEQGQGQLRAVLLDVSGLDASGLEGPTVVMTAGFGGVEGPAPLEIHAHEDDHFLVFADQGFFVWPADGSLSVFDFSLERVFPGQASWRLGGYQEGGQITGIYAVDSSRDGDGEAHGRGGFCSSIERRLEYGCLPVTDYERDCANAYEIEQDWIRIDEEGERRGCSPRAFEPASGTAKLRRIEGEGRFVAEVRWNGGEPPAAQPSSS
ncbi:MAG: hypothetical protein KC457_29795 [Myxococcales bacterium]|nr:hypothetical protein [Myxococcales bacterium]